VRSPADCLAASAAAHDVWLTSACAESYALLRLSRSIGAYAEWLWMKEKWPCRRAEQGPRAAGMRPR